MLSSCGIPNIAARVEVEMNGMLSRSTSTTIPLRLLDCPSRSSLATARALDPSIYLRDPPTNDVGNAAKVVVSFAQLVAATPFVLVVRRPNNLRSFLRGLNVVNVSGPKASKVLPSCFE